MKTPVHTVAIHVPLPGGPQAYWDAIRKCAENGEPFTVKDVWGWTNAHIDSVRDYLRNTALGGSIEKVGERPTAYRLINKTRFAPRFNSRGEKITQGSGQDNMWRAMGMLKWFTARELALASASDSVTVSEESAKSYIRHLHRAKYLAKSDRSRYRLFYTMKTGPLAPQVQRTKFVFDQNTQQVMPPEDRA